MHKVIRKKYLLTFLMLALGISVFYIYIWEPMNNPKIGENTDSCRYYPVPKEAKNISYYFQLLAPSYAYEFDIDEQGFLRWAQKHKYKVEEIESDQDFEVFTYRGLKNHDLYNDTKTITSGYKYQHQIEDRITDVGYDKNSGRAYVFFTSR